MEWCWVYSLYLLESDSNEAELLAVVKALELSSSTEDMFGRNIIVESDSANVVNWILKPCNRPWYLLGDCYYCGKCPTHHYA